MSALEVPHRPGVRFDTGYEPGDEVPPHYDSLIGKLMAWGPTRAAALHRLREALTSTTLTGVCSTVPAALAVLGHPDFVRGEVATTWFDTTLAGELAEDRRTPDLEDPAAEAAASDVPELDDTVFVAGRRYRIPSRGDATSAAPRRPRQAAPAAVRSRPGDTDGPEIRSPMQGTVTGVFVVAGDRVERGATLATVEAMKMEHPLRAPRAAHVAEVMIRTGESVAPGAPVIRLRDTE